jgi:hypothetical protein
LQYLSPRTSFSCTVELQSDNGTFISKTDGRWTRCDWHRDYRRCTGDGEDSQPEQDDESDETENRAETDTTGGAAKEDGTSTEDGTDADASDGDLEHESERAVFEYLQGIDDGDVEAANEALHPESGLRLEEGDIEEPGMTIHELEQVGLEEVTREVTDYEGEDLEQDNGERPTPEGTSGGGRWRRLHVRLHVDHLGAVRRRRAVHARDTIGHRMAGLGEI